MPDLNSMKRRTDCWVTVGLEHERCRANTKQRRRETAHLAVRHENRPPVRRGTKTLARPSRNVVDPHVTPRAGPQSPATDLCASHCDVANSGLRMDARSLFVPRRKACRAFVVSISAEPKVAVRYSRALRANTKRHGREIARRAIEATRTPSGLMPAASPAAARAPSPFGSSRPCRHERAPAARHESGSPARRFTKRLRPRLDAS